MTSTILAVFAHPDDETFIAGGTLAKYAGNGWRVSVLCATRGEAGQRGEYENISADDFALVRQREMESACSILGIRKPLFLNCADQRVVLDCQASAKTKVIQVIRRLKPDVVITFGPDGVSGHTDHVAISRIVTDAVRECRNTSALYYVLRNDSMPSCCIPPTSVPALPATTMIDVSAFGSLKFDAMHCYRSQEHMLPKDPSVVHTILNGQEKYYRAIPAWNGEGLENDLFVRQ